jgi:hypothetical protein
MASEHSTTSTHRGDGAGGRDFEHAGEPLYVKANSTQVEYQPPLIITVAPLGRGRFRAELDGCVIVASSRTPFVDAARVLIARGHDPNVLLAMQRVGDDAFALRAALGIAARLAVLENDRHAPKFIRWEAYPRWGIGQPVALALESHAGAPHDGGGP